LANINNIFFYFLSYFNKMLGKYLSVHMKFSSFILPISQYVTDVVSSNNHAIAVPGSSGAVLPPCPQA
jgi:hypothetical protein